MDRQLKRILDLVRKTGDRMVVTDPNGEDTYVIMGLDQYEDLISVASHEHCEDEEGWEPDWNPEMYGDLIQTEHESQPPGEELGKTSPPIAEEKKKDDLPEDLRAAVERDLAVLESWRKEKDSHPENTVQDQKVSENKEKNDDEEDRFYLEPIE